MFFLFCILKFIILYKLEVLMKFIFMLWEFFLYWFGSNGSESFEVDFGFFFFGLFEFEFVFFLMSLLKDVGFFVLFFVIGNFGMCLVLMYNGDDF